MFFSTQSPLTIPGVGSGQVLQYQEAGVWYRANLLGTTGSTGYLSLPTNSAPTSSTGSVGDYYLHRPQAGYIILYGPKQPDNTWPLIGRMEGSPNVGPYVGIPDGYIDGGTYGTAPGPYEPYKPTNTNPAYNYLRQVGFDGTNYYGEALWVYNPAAGWIGVTPVTNIGSASDVQIQTAQTGETLVWNGSQWVNQNLDAADVVFDNTASGLTATDVQAAIDEVLLAHDEASEISYDGATSGLSATDVQAAIDEVVDEQFTVAPRAWENTDWLTLISGAGAPSPSTGGPGWYYFDTTNEDLYGPAVFDGGIPGWDWGTALANVVFSATGPVSQAGDWYVWDENGDGSLYTLFQKKTTINYNDIIRAQSGGSWDVVTAKLPAADVHNDMQPLDPGLGVMNGHQLFNQLWTNTATAWGGYWSYFVEEEISGTYEIQAGYANNFYLTLTGTTTLNLPTDMNAQMAYDPSGQMANRSSEISVLLKQGPSGPYTLTFGSMIVEPNGGLAITNHADEVDWYKFITFDNGTTWFASRLGHRYLP